VIIGLCLAFLLSLGFLPLSGAAAHQEETGRSLDRPEGPSYHVRLMRLLFEEGRRGSALFKTDEFVVPLASHESWGSPEQMEALRQALGAVGIEPVPGLVVAAGPTAAGEPHRFLTALGESLVTIHVQAEELPDGQHRVQLGAEDEWGEEILDAALLVEPRSTVAVVAPLEREDQALVIGVTPMAGRPAPVPSWIGRAEEDGVTRPVVLESTKVMPVYPEMARRSGQIGEVVLEAVIRTDGVPDGIVVLDLPEGGERFAGAAVEAFSRWRYEPATLDGRPVPVYLTLTVKYALE
jgi:TonB family protein